jgi:hypothetical protein
LIIVYVPLKNISCIWRHHHCRWRPTNCRPMLSIQGQWARRDLYRVTPAVTRDLIFLVSSKRPLIQSSLTTGDVEDVKLIRYQFWCTIWAFRLMKSRQWYLVQKVGNPIDWLIDWLIIYGFTSRSRIFHLYGDVTIAGEGLQI